MDGKRFEISALLDTYGALLSARQRDVLDLYYNGDLSLAEIAEDTGITRQGVRDALKKGEAELLDYEEKLGFRGKVLHLRGYAEKLKELAFRSGDAELMAIAEGLGAEF
ncbi:MAG: DNA-binding protein [Clostridia bacterium]|nr:DNA-binding protein [Clostridia bacterium]